MISTMNIMTKNQKWSTEGGLKTEKSLRVKYLFHRICLYTCAMCTNTKSLAKEFQKILIFEYFGYVETGEDVFFDADSESPRMT